MQFEFNSLNLLDNVKQNGAVKASYTWAADGVKISAVSGNDGFEYLGSMVFSKTYSGIEPESVAFPEGRFLPTFAISSGGKFAPVFHHRNHLGSVCAESVIGHEMPLKTANDYMPYGTRFSADGYGEISQYTFSGKERQTLGSLGLLDFGARMYDPTTCRWLTNDPLAERYYNVSPYVYAGANPIRYIDPDDTKGNLMWNNGNWTKYATKDAIRIGTSMRVTETGTATFNAMIKSPTKIQMSISQELVSDGKSLTRGEFIPGDNGSIMVDKNGDMYPVSGMIVVYEGSLKAEINGDIKTSDHTSNLIRSLPKNKAVDGAIGSVAVHESIHITPKNINQQIKNARAERNNKPKPYDIEKEPIEKQNKHLEELKQQL